MNNLNFRYQLLKEKLNDPLEMVDCYTKHHFHISAREVVGNTEMLMELHPVDIRLICILAMQEYYEKIHPYLVDAQNNA